MTLLALCYVEEKRTEYIAKEDEGEKLQMMSWLKFKQRNAEKSMHMSDINNDDDVNVDRRDFVFFKLANMR